jgi:ACT domain-containing protein
MEIRKSVGRKPKVTYTTMLRLADAIQHNSTIEEACRYAGIGRTTYYSYLNNEVFAEKMMTAKENKNKVVFSFSTYF